MNTDIRISTSFLNHRKRKKLESILGDCATKHVIDLWITTAINRPDGILKGMDVEDIALDANWVGSPNTFIDAMVKVRFLDPPHGSREWYELHDWYEHQPWASNAESRSVSASKNQAFRWCIAEIKPKEAKDKFREWYYDVYVFIKGSNREIILAEYKSYTNSNTPIPSSPIPSSPNPIEEQSTAGAESKRLPTKDELENGSPILIKQTIKDMTEKLYNEKIFPKVHVFKNMMVKDGKNDSAILHVLSRCYLKGSTDKFDSKGPWGYCVAIMKVENGNYNERDHQKSV